MDYANPTEIWWPHPSALDDLSVEFSDDEQGSLIQLSAPEGTECADWLGYYQETEERRAAFERAFMQAILDQITMLENGKTQGIPDVQAPDHSNSEEDQPRSVEEHDAGCDV
jgi:hypothetical protein